MSLRILITGANRGIGLALAKAMHGRGATVIATAREPEHADELNTLAAEGGNPFIVLPLNVCQPDSVAACVKAVGAQFEGLDVLVNNAAVFPEEGDERFEDLRVEHFAEAFATNVEGVARVTQAFLPLLRHGTDPRVVNISSGLASVSQRTDSRGYCYGASKAALNSLTRGLANEFGPQGIIVVPVGPGWVKTPMGGPNAKLTPAESAAALAGTIESLTLEQSGQFLDRFGQAGTLEW